MSRRLEVFTGFNPISTTKYFEQHGWDVRPVYDSDIKLVKVQRNSALECGDGRFDDYPDREMYGPRVFGGINAVQALITGGDVIGLLRATELVAKFGFTPGTHSAEHGGCGYFDLWKEGKLDHANYNYVAPQEEEIKGFKRFGSWLELTLKLYHGKHFRLNGDHQEQAVRLNPFKGYTDISGNGSRFKVDDWFLADLGVPDHKRFHKIRETVEKLRPEAAKLEIILP